MVARGPVEAFSFSLRRKKNPGKRKKLFLSLFGERKTLEKERDGIKLFRRKQGDSFPQKALSPSSNLGPGPFLSG